MFRAAALSVICVAFAGCSRPGALLTRRPLFSAKDSIGAPKFRSGIWRDLSAEASDPPCKVAEAQPIKTWPDCAAPRLIALGRMVGFALVKTPRGPTLTARSFPYLLAQGAPLILQRFGDGGLGVYRYQAVDEVKLDEAGQIVAARLTDIDCYSPATSALTGNATTSGTANTATAPTPQLLPGFTQDKDSACRTRDLAALRDAAVVETAAAPDGVNFRWVRDGDR